MYRVFMLDSLQESRHISVSKRKRYTLIEESKALKFVSLGN